MTNGYYGLDKDPTAWLLDCDEPWTRYWALRDLLDRGDDAAEVRVARAEMLAHPAVQGLLAEAATWGQRPLTRHNDSSHPLYALSTLADFGLSASDPKLAPLLEAVLAHQSPEGAFQTPVLVPEVFGGSGKVQWTWMACDGPTLLYVLLSIGLGDDKRVRRAVEHLAGLARENGWRCAASPDLGKSRGPGRQDDPCPIANVHALKALSLLADGLDSPATRAGVEMLLGHWERQRERKLYLFGIGTDFRKFKYPFVWYDILHVTDVLTRYPWARRDPRLMEMVSEIAAQADGQGRFTAGSMYRPWKAWSFADKKRPSPWLTLLAYRVLKRASEG